MQALRDRLSAWVNAGLISAEQATWIEEHERRVGPPPGEAFTHDRGRDDAPPRRRRSVTSPAEAIGYVGAALALGAVALILGDLWRELLVGGRLTLVGVVTLAMFGGGLAVRNSDSTAMQRLTSVLFAASVAGTGWFAGVVGSDLLDLSWSETQVMVSFWMAAVALPLFLWRPRPLPQVVALGSVAFALSSLLELSPLRPGAGWSGLVIATVGVAWFLLAAGRWIAPRTVGEVAGALVALLGIQVASFGDPRAVALATGLVLAGVLVVLAVRADVLHHLVVGAVGLFILSPQLVFEVFGDAIGAPATLLLVGVLLVLLAVGLGRARREVVHEEETGRHEVARGGGARGGAS